MSTLTISVPFRRANRLRRANRPSPFPGLIAGLVAAFMLTRQTAGRPRLLVLEHASYQGRHRG